MKHIHTIQAWSRSADPSPSSIPTEIVSRVLVRDNLRCRICNSRSELLCYSRTKGRAKLRDVLALCEDCYRLARTIQRKRMQSRASHLLRFVCFVTLLMGTSMILGALALFLPPAMFTLCAIGIAAVLLLSSLQSRWF